jgi:hypothetical protein
MLPNERNNPMLVIDDYAFNKYKPNDDGKIGYRCKFYQKNCFDYKSGLLKPFVFFYNKNIPNQVK